MTPGRFCKSSRLLRWEALWRFAPDYATMKEEFGTTVQEPKKNAKQLSTLTTSPSYRRWKFLGEINCNCNEIVDRLSHIHYFLDSKVMNFLCASGHNKNFIFLEKLQSVAKKDSHSLFCWVPTRTNSQTTENLTVLNLWNELTVVIQKLATFGETSVVRTCSRLLHCREDAAITLSHSKTTGLFLKPAQKNIFCFFFLDPWWTDRGSEGRHDKSRLGAVFSDNSPCSRQRHWWTIVKGRGREDEHKGTHSLKASFVPDNTTPSSCWKSFSKFTAPVENRCPTATIRSWRPSISCTPRGNPFQCVKQKRPQLLGNLFKLGDRSAEPPAVSSFPCETQPKLQFSPSS